MAQNKHNKHCSEQDRTHPNASEPTYQGWVVQGQQKAPLQKKIFGLSQNLWHAVMKNGDLDTTLTVGEVNRRFTTSPAFSALRLM
jgi:hypothetical protein